MVQIDSTSTNAPMKFAEADKDSMHKAMCLAYRSGSSFPVVYTNLMAPFGQQS